LHEGSVSERLKNLRGDASTEIHSTRGKNFEGDIASLGPVGAREDLHGLEAERAGSVFGALADDCVRIFRNHAVVEPARFVDLFYVAEKGVDVLDAEA